MSNATFQCSIDEKGYNTRPESLSGQISGRIGKRPKSINQDNFRQFIELVGRDGHTFCPATFNDGQRDIDHFKQFQLLVLDFDSGITFKEIKKKTELYNLPILFAYKTFSSTLDHERFRVAFLNDIPVSEPKAAKAMQKILMRMFPESDKQCSDISRMYYGGKGLLHYDYSMPKMDIETLAMSMTKYLKDTHGTTHYKEKIFDVSKETGIALNTNNLLDISTFENIAEYESGKISPKSIILTNTNGEFLPTRYYAINFEDRNHRKPNDADKSRKIHDQLRSPDIKTIREKCQLFREFENGKHWLDHHELRGIALNFIHIETGMKVFLDALLTNSQYESYVNKYNLWDYYLSYFKQCDYKPESCDGFCPYKDKCSHGTNILSTVKPKYRTIERLANYKELFYPLEEVVKDVEDNITFAVDAGDNKIYIIRAQTAIGKTRIYLKIISKSDKTFLIVVPTNILKHDVMRRAEEMGIVKIIETPSLLEILSAILKQKKQK